MVSQLFHPLESIGLKSDSWVERDLLKSMIECLVTQKRNLYSQDQLITLKSGLNSYWKHYSKFTLTNGSAPKLNMTRRLVMDQ